MSEQEAVGPKAAEPEDRGSERFSTAGLWGRVASARCPADLERELRRMVDPGAARGTLHWGRNYLYRTDLETAGGPLPVVVKQFRNDGLRARLRRRLRESKAETSWRAARRLSAAGVATAEPVMWIESAAPRGPSFFVSREIEGFIESRYLFRALREGRREELFPGLDEESVIREMGRLIRGMHEAGVWHRDVSIGNVLVSWPASERERPRVWIIDLGRARRVRRMSTRRRLRDLCRLPVLERRHLEAYLDGYRRQGEPLRGPREGVVALAVRGFLLKNRLKSALRAPFRALSSPFRVRRAHPHIPPPPRDAGRRDKVVWDRLSDQPHQHAGRAEKLRVYLSDARIHGETVAQAAPAGMKALRRYRALRRSLHGSPHAVGGIGVGLRPWQAAAEAQLETLEALGVRRVLLRLHPWQESHRDEVELARELHRRGLDLTYALPQNRALVCDLAAWRAAVERIAESFLPYGRRFQIGQAVNRSKWGIWNAREYLELAASACEVLRARGEVELLGPAVIDFEVYATLALLNMRHAGCALDGLASLLYVDRRGAPENRQLGFDTIDKVVLLKAIAETSRNCGPGSWITEFNWPLWEGPHSPAGRKVAVDEESQADYLARFYLMVLGTGMVEAAYWWQLMAKGYGLVDPVELRRRPSFHALAALSRNLGGATFERLLPVPPPGRLYLFTGADGEALVAGWSAGEALEARLPGRPVAAEDRDGHSLPRPDGDRVELTGSPRYFRLGAFEA